MAATIRDHRITGQTSSLRSSSLRANIREERADLATDSRRSADDGNGNKRCDQAVFDGGRAGFVFEKTSENLGHGSLLTLVWFSTPTTVFRCSVGLKLQAERFQALKKNT